MATIAAACQCGKKFQANEKLAGKRVRCPACGAAIEVPALADAADPLGLSGSPLSPPFDWNAQAAMPPAGLPAHSPYGSANMQPNYGQQFAPPRKSNNNTVLIVAVIAGVVGLGFIGVIGIALLLPAIQAARKAAAKASNSPAAAAPGNNAPQANPAAAAPATASPGVADWKTYRSPTGRYSVLMPPNVQTRDQAEPTPAGLITAHMAIANAGGSGAYFVAHSDLPAAAGQIATDDALDGACTGSVQRVQGTEISRETITFAGQPARDLTFEGNRAGQQFRTRLKVFLAGRRLYQVMWVGSAANEPTDDLQQFFDSFQLTSVVADPAASADATQPDERELSEALRKVIFGDVLRSRRTIEKITQTRDKLAEQGADTTALDAQIDKLQEQQEPQLDALARRHRIAREKLDEIINEGDSNGWGNP